MISFQSDYEEGCIPEILEALQNTNYEQTSGYGIDSHCENAKKLIREACNKPNADIEFVVGGTQANLIVISSILRPYEGVICAESGHINVHETGAIEATGHKCLTAPTSEGKINAKDVEEMVLNQKNDASFEHLVKPGMIYISFPTETGTLYTKQELMDLKAVSDKYGLYLFIDGARLGYGLAAKCDVTLSDIATYSDVFYIGGTKVGALFGEAIVMTNKKISENFRYNIKQRGAMLAKGRLLGIQFEELFKNNRYFEISKNAMDCAELLADALNKKGYKFAYPVSTNQLFPILPNEKIAELQKDFRFLVFEKYDETNSVIRLVTSWATKKENVERLIEAL